MCTGEIPSPAPAVDGTTTTTVMDSMDSSPSLAESETTGLRRRRGATATTAKNKNATTTTAADQNMNGDHSESSDDDDSTVTTSSPPPPPKATYSSGVPFYPPSTKYWRIGGKWYDFADFLSKHPGGEQVLLLSRDRFEDCTFVFESHHHNYKKARAIIKKYEVSEKEVMAAGGELVRSRPEGGMVGKIDHYDSRIDAGEIPQLLPDDAFYSVIRRRVADHLRNVGYADGSPMMHCIVLFWASFFLWVSCAAWLYTTCSIPAAICTGFSAAWLGAFGHNWVHQPKYKFWAYLCLDTIGLCSDMWFRDHNLQHHMYTNTPWDNHFEGSAPFLVTDPTVERNWLQKNVMPYINPILLSFGPSVNYIAHLVEVLKGNEVVTPWKLLYPLEIAAMIYRWGWRGLFFSYLAQGILGVYYFTLALMNHNTEECVNVKKRNAAKDWGEAQLVVSADWGVGTPFWAAGIYLWLNYHTVHHLFPRVDMSHHIAIQQIMLQTCEEFGIEYTVKTPVEIYVEMVRTIASPRALMEEIFVYGGHI